MIGKGKISILCAYGWWDLGITWPLLKMTSKHLININSILHYFTSHQKLVIITLLNKNNNHD